jgi:AraC family transcriptional regulator
MSVRTGFVYLRPLNVAACRVAGPYSESSAAAWGKVFAWLNSTGMIRQIGTGYGLLLDDPRETPPEKCRYEACVELLDEARGVVPSEFNVRRLPGGAYARQRHLGGTVGLSKTISKLRSEWVPQYGVIVDTRRPVIEIYLDNPDHVPLERQRVDVCMPVTAVEYAGQTAA